MSASAPWDRSDDPQDGPRPAEGKIRGAGASKEEPAVPPADTEEPMLAAQPAPAPRRPAGRRRSLRGPDRAAQGAWVERLRQRDPTALAEVVGAYTERLTAVVAGLLRDRDAVEDVVQTTFTKAWYRIRSFRGNSSLYTWLYRIAVNATKDYMKSRRRRPAASLDELNAQQIPAEGFPRLEGIERRELRRTVRAAIDRLPERYRTVLALRELEGMSYQDIAEVLDLSLGTVESRLFRARRRLQALLEREGAVLGLGRQGASPGEPT